jgi:hypothetical protein
MNAVKKPIVNWNYVAVAALLVVSCLVAGLGTYYGIVATRNAKAASSNADQGGSGVGGASNRPSMSPSNAPAPTSSHSPVVSHSPTTRVPTIFQTSTPSTYSGAVGAPSVAFNIELDFSASPSITAAQRNAFVSAKLRWETVITGDIASFVTISAGTRLCGVLQKTQRKVDDLLIYVNVSTIDGKNGILASAGKPH